MTVPNSLGKRASLHTLGCRLNQAETILIREKLEADGYEIVAFGEPADLGIINTCTVTNEADAKSRKLIRSFIRTNPEAYVAVIGCYAQMGAKAIAEIEGVDLIVGNQEKLNVLEYARQGRNPEPLIVRDRIDRDGFTIDTAGVSPLSRRANLKIQDGCDFMCSFCVIPFARGRARSRDFQNLLVEARQLADRGVRELVLTGVNIGTYADGGHDLVDVLDALNAIEDIRRVRISSIEPTTAPEALFERMSDPGHSLLPYLHLPLQSGSGAVLEGMRRRYTRADYLDFVERAAVAVPEIGIGTDILVGMPGETDVDFEDTCTVLRDSPLFYAHVFKFSERDGTAAVRMADKVSPQIKDARGAVIRRLSAEKLRQFHARHAGRTHEVLFEEQENGFWTGYTGNFIRVAACSDDILENEARSVRLGQSLGDMMMGEVVAEHAGNLV